LIRYVDDFGRGSADPELLKGFVFPRRKGVTEQTIGNTLRELASLGSIQLYDVDGESYLVFPGWEKHQTPRAKVSKYPAPPIECNQNNDQESTCKQMQADASKCKQVQADAPDIRNRYSINDKRYSDAVTNARAQAAADLPAPDSPAAYASSNLQYMSPHAFEELATFQQDLPDDVILHGIDAACNQGKRTWAYTRSILNRYVSDGYKSIGDVMAAEDKHKRQGGTNDRNHIPEYKDFDLSEGL
jgi:DnaD/phage-associated family protein